MKLNREWTAGVKPGEGATELAGDKPGTLYGAALKGNRMSRRTLVMPLLSFEVRRAQQDHQAEEDPTVRSYPQHTVR